MKRLVLTAAAFALTSTLALAGPFTAGNLAVLRADDNSLNNTTATIIELNKTTAGQTPTNLISIPGAGVSTLRISGSASTTGFLSHSNDRTLLTLNGHNSTTAGNANTLNPRGVGTLDANGTFAVQTTYTGASGNQTRSSTSLNNTTWYIADQGGYYSNGTSSASPAVNIRSIKAFGGAVYSFTAAAGVPAVNKISAPTGGTQTALPGIPNNPGTSGQSSASDFYMIQSGSNGLLL